MLSKHWQLALASNKSSTRDIIPWPQFANSAEPSFSHRSSKHCKNGSIMPLRVVKSMVSLEIISSSSSSRVQSKLDHENFSLFYSYVGIHFFRVTFHAFCKKTKLSASAVDRFPCIERERLDSTSESNTNTTSSRGKSSLSGSGKLQDHAHTREVIFALPSLQLHLKTEHLQNARTPDVAGNYRIYPFFF